MQTPRMFDPNELITLTLPAQLLNVLVEQLQKSIPVFPYTVYQPMMIEVMTQVQAANEKPPVTAAPPAEISQEHLARIRSKLPRPNSETQPPAAE